MVTAGNELLLPMNSTSEVFQDCLKINRNWNKDMTEVVQCRLAKEIDCEEDSRTRHHRQKERNCMWKWLPSADAFKVTLSDNGNLTSAAKIPRFLHAEFDIIGHLRCKIYDGVLVNSYIIEEPFQVHKPPKLITSPGAQWIKSSITQQKEVVEIEETTALTNATRCGIISKSQMASAKIEAGQGNGNVMVIATCLTACFSCLVLGLAVKLYCTKRKKPNNTNETVSSL